MPEDTIQVQVSANVRVAVAWIGLMRIAAYVIGPERAFRAASWGATRLVLVRFDGGRWHWLRP